MADNKCYNCAKTVYPQEQIVANAFKFHKGCFKCNQCNLTLNMNNFVGVAGDKYTVFCKVHAPKSAPVKSGSSASLPKAAPSSPSPAASPAKTSTAAPLKTSAPAPAKTTAAPAKTAAAPAPAKAATPAPKPAAAPAPSSSSNNNNTEDQRQRDAAKFIKRSRHRFDFESKLTAQQIEDFRKLFALYDKDKSGTINIQELATVLPQVGYNFNPDNIRVIVRIVDENKDGVLNFHEFLGLYDFLDFLKTLFNTADKDGSGSMDRRELNVLLKRAGYKFSPEQTELFFRMCDEDGSNSIELDDFLSLMLFIFFAQIMFAAADKDGNDSIEFKEFQEIMYDLGLDMEPSEALKFFKELDSDNSGSLSFEEYIELVFELRYPLISTIHKILIEEEGVSDELKEHVEVNPDEKLNLMEASGFIQRSRHQFDFKSKLTPQQIEDFRNLFKLYDKDNSNTIDIQELSHVLEKLGYTFTEENIDHIIAIVDDNMDGELNFQEFLGFYDFLEYLKDLFESADADKSGSIDRKELKALLEKANYHFSDKQIELLYKMSDEDDSGVIEVSDFFSLTLFVFWAQILFAKADTDGNDTIDLTEFNNVLKRLGFLMPPDVVVKYFADLDTDNSGNLSFEEYIELIFMLKFLIL